MERVKKIIFQKINNKDNSVDFNSVEHGINEYIKMNGLDVIAKKLDDKALTLYMNSFLAPLDTFSGEMLLEYFRNYETFARFKILSNGIFEIARSKRENKDASSTELTKMYEELTKLYSVLYSNATMQRFLDQQLSECRLDLDYVCHDAHNYSIRLNEWMKRKDGNAGQNS